MINNRYHEVRGLITTKCPYVLPEYRIEALTNLICESKKGAIEYLLSYSPDMELSSISVVWIWNKSKLELKWE